MISLLFEIYSGGYDKFKSYFFEPVDYVQYL